MQIRSGKWAKNRPCGTQNSTIAMGKYSLNLRMVRVIKQLNPKVQIN